MSIEKKITEEVERSQLVWFGHVTRMKENKLFKIILQWTAEKKSKS